MGDSPLSLTRVTIIAAAVESSREGFAPPARRRWSSAHTAGRRLGAQVVFEDPDTDAADQVDRRIIIPAIASPRTNFDAPSIARRNRPRWQHLYVGFVPAPDYQPGIKIGVNRHLLTGHRIQVKRAETSEIRSAPLVTTIKLLSTASVNPSVKALSPRCTGIDF